MEANFERSLDRESSEDMDWIHLAQDTLHSLAHYTRN
jgi:hypothetical protein